MQERKQTTKYLWPVAFAVILIFSLMTGIFFTRNSLMKLTVEERSYQLEEMVTQIRANLHSGLQLHRTPQMQSFLWYQIVLKILCD